MKLIFENWRKHLNENEREEFVPRPELEKEDSELADMRSYLEYLASKGTGRGTLGLYINTETMTVGTHIDKGTVLYVNIDGKDNYYSTQDEMVSDLESKPDMRLMGPDQEGTFPGARFPSKGKEPGPRYEGTSKKQKAHDAREVDKKAWRKKADAIANDLGWPNRARWDDEKQTYYIQNNDTQERGQDVPQPK